MRWLVSPRHDALGTSSIVAGLGSLARSGEIQLSLEPLQASRVEPHVLHLVAEKLDTTETRRIAIEVFDRPDRFDLPTLAGVDRYYKQTLDRTFLDRIPDSLVRRVRPGGLTFATRMPGSLGIGMRGSLAALVAHASSHGATGVRSAAIRRLRDTYDILTALDITDWERTPADPLLHDVVYQTRLWPDAEAGREDRRSVNRGRIAVVRTLRDAFGGKDRIGLITTEFAETEAPDALLSRKISRREYATQLRTSLISVNTDGLDGSPGFKIAESLAAGAALVSQPFRFELPEPLLPGVNYLPFREPDECVEQCRKLLDDEELAERMRRANLTYYRRFVEPEAHVRNLLASAFE